MSGLPQQIAFEELSLVAGERESTAEEAFAALVRRQSRFVFRVAYAVLRNTHDAEDAVQETFLKIYRARACNNIRDERAFLARAAWRVAVERRSRKRPGHEPLRDIPSSQTLEGDIIRADRQAMLQLLIDGLPEELRMPLVLCAIEELRSHDVAELMGIPDGTVRSRIGRARRILKEKLAVLLEDSHASRS